MYSDLIQKLDKINDLASGSKFVRLINNPVNYLLSIGYRSLVYPVIKEPLIRSAQLFWGDQLGVALPSGVDMYILGAKADDSEIRLTKYLINSLQRGNSFIDVGAHFGYYSKLAAHLVGPKGIVISAEPADKAFNILDKNTREVECIEIYNSLIGRQSAEVTFYEFPTEYAEYNSIDIDQYRTMDWFDKSLATQSQRKTLALDDLINGRKIDFIKIDVEGSEYEVLLGASLIIQSNYPQIGMEYVHASRSNKTHRAAVDHLRNLGYRSNLISNLGRLELVTDLDQSLDDRGIESDNFIFIHSSDQTP